MRWWRRLSTAKILAFARPWCLWWQLVWLIQTGLDNPDYDVRWEKKDYVNWFCDLGPQPLQGIICKLWYFSWLEMKLVGEESHSFQSTQLICLLHHVTCRIQGRKPWHNCPRPLEPSLESVESDVLPASGEIAGEVFCLHSCSMFIP